jgi:hypothetical protein
MLIFRISLLFAFTIGVFTTQVYAQTPANVETSLRAQIFFKESSHDFGNIKQGEKVTYTFEYTNIGQAPLTISNVQTTCGCTASQWSRAPLAPGKTGKLTATFDSKGKVGRQNKVISIFSNALRAEEHIRIVASVIPDYLATPADSTVAVPK